MRKGAKQMEVLWRGAKSFGDSADVFTANFPTGLLHAAHHVITVLIIHPASTLIARPSCLLHDVCMLTGCTITQMMHAYLA